MTITGVLEEAKFFGISGILEQLEEMVKVRYYTGCVMTGVLSQNVVNSVRINFFSILL